MENKENREGFSYTYSAEEQQELKRIREKYLPKEENKMEQLRSLDSKATGKATMIAIIIGMIGTLLLGVGMCCTLVWQGRWFVPGIFVGIIGIGIVAIAYPVYNKTLKTEREKIAPEVLRLTEELLK